MTLNEFDNLPDKEKKDMLIDARKISESENDIAKNEVFQIEDFFVEVSLSVTRKFRTIIKTYSSNGAGI